VRQRCWIDGVELAGLDQGGDGRPVFAAVVAASEQGILSSQGHRPHAPLDRVGVELDPAVIEELRE
jgi:hypothetical protein